MRTFVISLPSAHARREHARRELSAAGVPFEFFDAFDGPPGPQRQHLPVNVLSYRVASRRSPVQGEIGCYASHRAVWRLCAELGEPVLVLEDDFRLAPEFTARLSRIEALTREYGFVRLEGLHRPARRLSMRPNPPIHAVRNDGDLKLYYVADVPTSMMCYALDAAAAAALFEAGTPLRAPVDRYLQRTWAHGVPVFGVEPALVRKGGVADDSTIGSRPRSRNPALLALRLLDGALGKIRRKRFNDAQLRRLGLIGAAARRASQTPA